MRSSALAGLALLTAILVTRGAPARAIPAPLPVDRLVALATDIVEGEVVKVSFLSTSVSGSYRVSVFEAELKVSRVTKGKLAAGQTLTISFSTESWVGPGRQPPGRTPHPAYFPCEQVRAYLRVGKTGRRYFTASWNGRRSLRAPASYRLPDRASAPLRCVAGQVR
jgi:hypothetical protein